MLVNKRCSVDRFLIILLSDDMTMNLFAESFLSLMMAQ